MGATAGCPAQIELPLTGRRQRGRKGPSGQPERHQGGRKGSIGQLLRGTKEAGKDQLDSLQGTREAPGRQEKAIWTDWKAPGRHQGDLWHRIADRIPVLEGRRILSNFFNTTSMANGPVRGKFWAPRPAAQGGARRQEKTIWTA